MTLVFLPRYPEPRKVPTNPRWCPYVKGSPREGQAPRSSNSIESRGPSPRASGAPLPAPLGRSPSSPLSSFRPKRCGPRSLRYTVAAVTQTLLSRCWGEGEDATLCSMPSPISLHQQRQNDWRSPPFVQHAAGRRPTTRSHHPAPSSNVMAHVEFDPL
jgi:hypothetical protein